jgi:hypothetical protein
MNRFYRVLGPKDSNALWESDLKWWIVECKETAPVTSADLKKWDNILNSGTEESKSDVASFCDLTGWKYGHI